MIQFLKNKLFCKMGKIIEKKYDKNIEKQRTFYSTKKKRKEKKVRLPKPTSDEKD